MARPKKTGLDYFPHDVDLSNDPNIERLESTFGLEGYAVYLKLLERIYRNGGKLFLSDEESVIILAKKFNLSQEVLIKIISGTVVYQLFKKSLWENAKCLTSDRIIKTMKAVSNKRVKSRKKVSASETKQ